MNKFTLSNSRAAWLNLYILNAGHASPKAVTIGLEGVSKNVLFFLHIQRRYACST